MGRQRVGAVTSPEKGAPVPTPPQAVTGDDQPHHGLGDIHHYGTRERLSRASYRLRWALPVMGWHSWSSGEEHLRIVQDLLWDVQGRNQRREREGSWFGEEQTWESRGKRNKWGQLEVSRGWSVQSVLSPY